jgi:glycosyl transferase family 25
MQIYYINLESRPDRRQRLELQLGQLGLSAIRISATTPGDIDPQIIAKYCRGQFGNPLSAPELACTFSHLAAMKKIATGREPFGLVLEDDMVLSTMLPDFLARFEAAPAALDILKLDTDRYVARVLNGKPPAIAGISLSKVATDRMGCGAYIISRSAAKRISDAKNILALQIDESLYRLTSPAVRGLELRHADPGLASHPHLLTGTKLESNLTIARHHARDTFEPTVSSKFTRWAERRLYWLKKLILQVAARGSTKRIIPFPDATAALSRDQLSAYLTTPSKF